MCWFTPRNGFVTPSFSPKLRHQPLSDLLEVKNQIEFEIGRFKTKSQVDHEYDASIQKAEEGQNYPSITADTFNANPRQDEINRRSFITHHLILKQSGSKHTNIKQLVVIFHQGDCLSDLILPFIAFPFPPYQSLDTARKQCSVYVWHNMIKWNVV